MRRRDRSIEQRRRRLATVRRFVLFLLSAGAACRGSTLPGNEQLSSVPTHASGLTTWTWKPEGVHPCNIRRISFADLPMAFPGGLVPALHPAPLVITSSTSAEYDEERNEGNGPEQSGSRRIGRNERFRNATESGTIQDNFPRDFAVTLSSSNSFSEHRVTVPFQQYLEDIMGANGGETLPTALSNESWYLFGETYGIEWKPLLDLYELPPCTTCTRDLVALSFGMGNRGSGVQWHVHGPGFSEAIHGRKHWVLYPPSQRESDEALAIPAGFDKDESSRQWMEYRYPLADPKPLECTLNPSDIIYFPDRFWHATINLDPYTVFVSSFTTEHGVVEEALGDEL